MSIKYRIETNNLLAGTFYARVAHGQTIYLDQMIPNIVTKTSLSPTDIRGAIAALTEEVVANLIAGNCPVIDGLASFLTSLSGKFDTADTNLTRETAQLNVAVQADRGLAAAVAAQASYIRQVAEVKVPIINSFFDAATNSYDNYTAGSVVRLKGDHLKFDPTAADEGVFINNGAVETRLTVYSAVGTKRIDALLPADTSGSLTVTVRTHYTDDGDLRQGVYQRPVTPA